MESLEAEKIITIQTSTGSQYLMKARNFGTAHGTRVFGPDATLIRSGGKPLRSMTELNHIRAHA
jgi:hypothetical protein